MSKTQTYKHVELFPQIINRDAFYNRKHPVLHPNSQEYLTYWREEKKRCIEGRWVEEADKHWRWMYPTLYFYINHWEIQIIDERNKSRYFAPPDLTDVEWIIGAYHTASTGFSGFEGDKKYTCNFLVKKWEQAKRGDRDETGEPISLTKQETEILMNNDNVKIPFGSYKEFIDPFEYLKLHHEEPLGLPLYENDPHDEMWFTSRGNGKSFFQSAIVGHEYTFDGYKYYEDAADKDGFKLIGEVMVGANDPGKTEELTKKIEHGLQSFKGAYSTTDLEYPPPFYKTSMGGFGVGDVYRNRYKVYKAGRTETVSGSIIYSVNFGSDVDAGASKRLSKQIVDEVGLLEDADEMHGVSEHSKEAGGTAFGQTIYSGTGGNVRKSGAAKKMFYNPLQYNIYPINDYWENKGKIGLFMPATYSDRTLKDENGNTRHELVLEKLQKKRDLKARSMDPLPLLQEKMFRPLKPSEMFINTEDNIMPKAMAVERINDLEADQLWEKLVSVGEMEWGNKDRTTVKWEEKPNKRNSVIKDLMLDKYADKTGVWAIYEHPDAELEVVKYIVVYDPYRNDGKGESFGSILVYKHFPSTTDRTRLADDIVAEFIGRPFTIADIHKQAAMAAVYFGTKVLFERNVPGFKTWMKTENLVHLLEPEPFEAVKDGSPNKKRDNNFGVQMSGPLKSHCLGLFVQWLKEPLYDDEGNLIRYNIGKLKSQRLLNEIDGYGDGNFDHISTSLLWMLWLQQQKLKPLDEKVEERQDEFDDFFQGRLKAFSHTIN